MYRVPPPPPSDGSVGRGRGREVVKPAWMTDPNLMSKVASTDSTSTSNCEGQTQFAFNASATSSASAQDNCENPTTEKRTSKSASSQRGNVSEESTLRQRHGSEEINRRSSSKEYKKTQPNESTGRRRRSTDRSTRRGSPSSSRSSSPAQRRSPRRSRSPRRRAGSQKQDHDDENPRRGSSGGRSVDKDSRRSRRDRSSNWHSPRPDDSRRRDRSSGRRASPNRGQSQPRKYRKTSPGSHYGEGNRRDRDRSVRDTRRDYNYRSRRSHSPDYRSNKRWQDSPVDRVSPGRRRYREDSAARGVTGSDGNHHSPENRRDRSRTRRSVDRRRRQPAYYTSSGNYHSDKRHYRSRSIDKRRQDRSPNRRRHPPRSSSYQSNNRRSYPRAGSTSSRPRHKSPAASDVLILPDATCLTVCDCLLSIRKKTSRSRREAIAVSTKLFNDELFRGEDHRGAPLYVDQYLDELFADFPDKVQVSKRIYYEAPESSFCVEFESRKPHSTVTLYECKDGLLTRAYIFRDVGDFCDPKKSITLEQFTEASQNGGDILKHFKKKGLTSVDEMKLIDYSAGKDGSDSMPASEESGTKEAGCSK